MIRELTVPQKQYQATLHFLKPANKLEETKMKIKEKAKKQSVWKEPLHTTLALDVLMRWTQMRDIATKKTVREFLFRVAFVMDLQSVSKATGVNDFLALYTYRKRKYNFTLGVLEKYIGYIATDEQENSLPREAFFKSLFLNNFKAMMKAGSYGIGFSMPKRFLKESESGTEVKNPEPSPENIRNAELVADRMMKKIPAEAFKGRNREFLMKEMSFRPYEDHLPRHRLPKPTPGDYAKRKQLEERSMKSTVDESVYLNLMNSFDWSARLFRRKDRYGLKSALGEVLIPAKFEDFMMMTQQEIKNGDLVVTRDKGKWGVLKADGRGTWILKPEFEYIGFPNNITFVCKDGKWGVIDILKGKYLIEPECDEILHDRGFMFINRVGFYVKNEKYGVIMDWGAFTKPVFEDYGGDIDAGPVKVKYRGRWGYINEKNEFTEDEDDAYYWYSLD